MKAEKINRPMTAAYTSTPAAGATACIQRKAAIAPETNPLEDEVDEKADRRVMRMPESPFVQRRCAACEKEKIQAKGGEGGMASETASQRIKSSQGGGQPMQGTVRNFMEQRFEADFSGVRIHNGGEAAQLSDELNAQAFTVGRDIYFNSGKYHPESDEGKHLLAHELTHTLQQKEKGKTVQRSVKDEGCKVHAYDNSDPEDKAVVFERSGWDKFWGNYYPSTVGVSSVDDMVAKTNAYINSKDNDCKCVSRLEISGHGTDGYQSVGNGKLYANNDKALVHDSAQPHLEKLKTIKFCEKAMLLLQGCHVGKGLGKTLMKKISNILPGVLIGGAEHYTVGTGMGKKKVVDNDADVDKKYNVDSDKATAFMNSPHVRWYFTSKTGEEYTKGSDNTPADLDLKIKAADKVKVVTPEGQTIKIK